MAMLADFREKLRLCAGCRRRRAALRRALSRLFGSRPDRPQPQAPDFSSYFLFVEHVDDQNGTITFRLNDRHEEGYRLGMKIPVDWQNRPVGPAQLIETMVARAIPAVRRDLAGNTPPDFRRLTALQGQRINISESIERHYNCEDCQYA